MLSLTQDQKRAVQQSQITHGLFDQYEESFVTDSLAAEETRTEEMRKINSMITLIEQHGLTKALYAVVDPNGILLHKINAASEGNFDRLSDQEKTIAQTAILNGLKANLQNGMSEEGVREVLHSEKFRHWMGLLAGFYTPDTAAQRAAGKAAKAAGLDKAGVKDAIRKAGPSFFRGLFRAMVIGTIISVATESAIKIVDKIVNKGRVLGSVSEVQANVAAIKNILAKINEAASLKVALDGSDAEDVQKKASDILVEIRKIYDATPGYTMVKGSETGWTVPLLNQTGKQYDAVVKDTDQVSQNVGNAAQGELAMDTDDNGKPNPAVVNAVKERSRTVAKGIRLANKLVKSTTRVFTELTNTIETKGASKVVKDDKTAQS